MKKNINISFLYYLAFAFSVIFRLITCSTLIEISHSFRYLLLFFICLLFLIKIILEKNSFLFYIIFIVFLIISIYYYIKLDDSLFLFLFFTFFGIKNVDIKIVIKIDFICKTISIFLHSIIYFLNYLFLYSSIENLIKYSSKGISHSLFYSNPNTPGLIVLFLIIDFLYLKKNVKFKDLVICLVFIIISFVITKSRTPFYIYLLYILLNCIKNKRLINILFSFSYLILTIISYYIVCFVNLTSKNYFLINKLLSNRLGFSIKAYNEIGLRIIPYKLPDSFFSNYIIDNYFVKCFILYGLVFLIILYLPYIIIKEKKFLKEKIIIIISNIYLFFETTSICIGFSNGFLLLGDLLFNKGKEI